MVAIPTLTYDDLKKLIEVDTVAIRGVATLEPAGGPGDKIFPPTHAVDDKNKKPGAKYAFETRRINGQDATCVLIDSVQSQANRMEEALQALWDEGKIALLVVTVDFSQHPTEQDENGTKKALAPEVGRVTSLTAPHRIADALLRDSLLDGKLFRLSEIGKSFTDASTKNATALFKVCPTDQGIQIRSRLAAVWALMANNPSSDGTRVDAPLEWLAFRGLPLLPSFPRGTRIITTGVVGRGDDMTFMWPLWSIPASLLTTRSALQIDWGSAKERAARGVFAICSSAIRRTSQGFGNFGPSSVTS
jgi:CRISPR-associated protein Csb1